jgi:tyrosine-protein kinase Etk/Wzc
VKDSMAQTGSEKAVLVSEETDTIDIGRIFSQLWASKSLIGICVGVGIFLGLFIYSISPKTYQADALLQLESQSSQMGLPMAMLGLGGGGPQSATEIEIIRSRLVLGQAVAALNLDWMARPVLMPIIGVAVQRYDMPIPDFWFFRAYARRAERISLDLLQVEPDWIGKPMRLTITGEGTFNVELPTGTVLSGRVGETLNDADKTFGLRVADLVGSVGRQFVIMQRDELDVLDALQNSLMVGEKSRGSGILELKYRASSDIEAQRVLNAISDAYVKQNVLRRTANADNGLQFLDSQLTIAEQNVRKAQEELTEYSRKSKVLDLSFESNTLWTQTERVNTALQELQVQEDDIKQRYTINHPVYQKLLNNRAHLEKQLADLQKEAERLPETQRNVLTMTRKLELAQDAYLELQKRAQEAEVMRASTIGSVRVVDLAHGAERPVAPRGSLILVVTTLLGGLIGVALVLVRAWLRRGVQSAKQIEALGMPVFATVNYVPLSDSKRNKKGEDQSIVALTDPTNIAVEAFRSLRTSLHFGMLDATTNSLVVTSSAPGVGKSFSSVNLATVMAQGGQRVCLIDADMRRGHLRKFFKQPKKGPGLADYLAEVKTLDEVLIKTPVEGLSVICAGAYPPNPADLLVRPRMHELLRLLNERFDMVILDAPPVLAVTDAVLMGRIAGGILLIARHDMTPIGEIEATKRTLEAAGLKVTGAVLNGFDPSKVVGGDSYSYRYDYKSHSD